jgi:hypothetical protein
MSFSWFISVDDHLIEPAQLWQDRLSARWRDTGPRIVRDGSSEFWAYEDRQIVTTGLNAVAGKTREEFSPEPISYASHVRGEEKGESKFDLDTDIRRLFAEHVYGTFIEDQAGLRLLDIIGEDNVMLECDYPHSDSTWPDTVAMASKWLENLPQDTQDKITVGNASGSTTSPRPTPPP